MLSLQQKNINHASMYITHMIIYTTKKNKIWELLTPESISICHNYFQPAYSKVYCLPASMQLLIMQHEHLVV